jgi:hypothetical protein
LNAGQTAGVYVDSIGQFGSFLRDASGNFTTFAVPGATLTLLNALNASGETAGSWSSSGGVFGGFLRDASGAITTFFPGPFEPSIKGLNDYGEIAGYVSIPEPSSVVLLGIGLVVLLGCSLARRRTAA